MRKNKDPIPDQQIQEIIRLGKIVSLQREYMARAIHCLEYFEQQNQSSKIRFWLNQCAEDLRRNLST